MTTHLLYHYSPVLYPQLQTRRYSGIAPPEEIRLAETRANDRHVPGRAYVDHISFFFDPIPSVLLSRIFGTNHLTWFTGSKLYEYVVDINNLDERITYDVVESNRKTALYDKFSEENNWVDDNPELLKKWQRLEFNKRVEWGELGFGRANLIKQMKINGGHLDKDFLAAYNRADFEENRQKYAANVPHVMLYPKEGYVIPDVVQRLTIGNNRRQSL